MFTGIIETLGVLQGVTTAPGGARLSVAPERPLSALAVGESIAVNGVCLTIEPDSREDRLVFFMSGETISRTTLGKLGRGAPVNLERALRADSRLGGHMVAGHVDGIGTIRRFRRQGESWELEVAYPADLGLFLAPKGSVAVDGISLTVVEARPESFTVAVIPHTAGVTTLRQADEGREVNLEVDMLARYVVRALEVYGKKSGGVVTEDLLKRAGF